MNLLQERNDNAWVMVLANLAAKNLKKKTWKRADVNAWLNSIKCDADKALVKAELNKVMGYENG